MDSGLERLITLTRQMQDGDMSGFDEFYERTKKFIYFSIVKIVDDFTTGEDLLQETYVYFLEHLSHLKTDQSPMVLNQCFILVSYSLSLFFCQTVSLSKLLNLLDCRLIK